MRFAPVADASNIDVPRHDWSLMRNALIAGLLAFATPALLAQPHPSGIAIGGQPWPTFQLAAGAFVVDKNTGALTTLANFANAQPMFMIGTQTDYDNQSLVFGSTRLPTTMVQYESGFFRYDPTARRYSTLAQNPADFALPLDITAGPDGDWYASSRTIANQYAVYQLHAAGGYSTIVTTMQFPGVTSVHALDRDIDTGELLIAAGTNGWPLIFARSRAGTLSTYHSSQSLPQLGTQRIATGEHFFAGQNIFRWSRGSARTIPVAQIPATKVPTFCLFENQSTPNAPLIVLTWSPAGQGIQLDLEFRDPSQNFAITRTLRIQNIGMTAVHHDSFEHYRSRYIQTARSGRQLQFGLRFPVWPGRAYVAALGHSGVRPGLRLPDGRHIWLNPDPLVFATAQNLVPGIFRPGPGVLDANGLASGGITLPATPLGITVHLIAVVLDPAAPLGVAFVTEPYPIAI